MVKHVSRAGEQKADLVFFTDLTEFVDDLGQGGSGYNISMNTAHWVYTAMRVLNLNTILSASPKHVSTAF